MAENMRSKGMIMDISSMSKFAIQLLGKGKEYEPLLRLILKIDPYDEDEPIPAVKTFSEKLKMPYTLIRKQLNAIYNDLISYESDVQFNFKKAVYEFRIHGREEYLTWKVDMLDPIPRVGENISLPYFSEYLDDRNFYVKSITHEFFVDEHIVAISLLGGWYNLFWHFRKDEAHMKRELPLRDFYTMDEYQLQSKLGYR